MTRFRTLPPEAEPVTLAEAKAYLRLQSDSEDDLVTGLVKAAREDVERATGTALIDQGWRLVLDAWPVNGIAMLMPFPVKEITSVTAYGSEGEAWVVNPADYLLDANSRPARLYFETRPEPLRVMNGIEIDFTAGFGEAGPDVPDLLRRAILLLVAHWYEFRAQVSAEDQPVSYPAGYDRMIAGYKARRL
ncbi:MAG: head-tail connector protein [Rhizobiaceae bacterium]